MDHSKLCKFFNAINQTKYKSFISITDIVWFPARKADGWGAVITILLILVV